MTHSEVLLFRKDAQECLGHIKPRHLVWLDCANVLLEYAKLANNTNI